MKMRKFLKRILKVKYLILLLAIILVVVIGGLYLKKDLVEYKVPLDNLDFTTDDFEEFAEKEESSMLENKVVGENNQYKMFIDEKTTIVTTVLKSSLVSGGDVDNPKDYTIRYSSANPDGAATFKGNFSLTYASTNISKTENGEFNAFSQSVNYKDGLTGELIRNYSIKYLKEKDAVQIYYTIGNFGSTDSYFPKEMYATVYTPPRCLFSSEEEYNKLVDEYENDYLKAVGSLDNTFEERYRGNTQIYMTIKRDSSVGKAYVTPNTTIVVYSQEARDYLLKTVLPEMAADGIDAQIYTEQDILDLDEKARKEYKDSKSTAKYPSVKWSIKVPEELVDIYGEYYKKYFNNENSPLTNNPFFTAPDYNTLATVYYSFVGADGSTIKYDMYTRKVNPGPASESLYAMLYSGEQKVEKDGKNTYEYVVMKNGEEIPYSSSGYVAKDDEGNYIYDEDGYITKKLYTKDQLALDNSLRGVETPGLPVFRVALEFKLTDTGYVVTVPRESLVDSTNVKKSDPYYKVINGIYQMVNIKLCPYMTDVNTTQEGYIIVPDGSGAVINFNNGKNSSVSGNYYGKDHAFVDMVEADDSVELLLGMYAFVNTTPENPSGLIAAIEKGGGQFSLTAGVSNINNYAYLTAILRNKETTSNGVYSTPFDKYDKSIGASDLVVNYIMVDAQKNSLDYSNIAKIYQDYLVKRDGLSLNDNTNTLLNDLTFLGAFDKYALFMGIKYTTTDTLTTFNQAKQIMDELMSKNVNNMSVSYKGWTRENLEYELGGSLKASKELGKTTSMTKFYEYCVEKGVTFYPEISITTAKGYDYTFGSLKYTARSVVNEEAVHYPFDLATGRQDKELKPTYAIAPLYYRDITKNILKDFKELEIWSSKENGGFLLTDLGNQWTGNYRKGSQVYGGDAVYYQQDALELIAKNNKIKIEAPCDYAFKYVDIATNIPVESNMYTIYDMTIPFYQLVVNGLFDYTTENINGLSNKSSAYYFVKSLETGSNLSYMLSAEDPSILLETDYTQYYQAYYQNWKDTIVELTEKIDSLNIHGCYLTKHEVVKVGSVNLARVTYTSKTNSSNQIVLLINATNQAVKYNGIDVPAYSYIKEK